MAKYFHQPYGQTFSLSHFDLFFQQSIFLNWKFVFNIISYIIEQSFRARLRTFSTFQPFDWNFDFILSVFEYIKSTLRQCTHHSEPSLDISQYITEIIANVLFKFFRYIVYSLARARSINFFICIFHRNCFGISNKLNAF